MAVPLLVFCYRRPEHTRRCLESLLGCDDLGACQVRIYCDGPVDGDDEKAIGETLSVAREFAPLLNAEIRARDRNLGLPRSIVEGVSEAFRDAGRVIVVENDLVLARGFLTFVLEALQFYANEPRVMQVAGYAHPLSGACPHDAYFLPMTSSWGWATWSRAWSGLEKAMEVAQDALRRRQVRHRFDAYGAYPYSRMLVDRLEGRNHSWAVVFYWHVFAAQGLAVYPSQSLVENTGFDGTGVHCGTVPDMRLSTAADLWKGTVNPPVALPAVTDPSADRTDAWVRFLVQERRLRSTAPWWRAVRLIRRIAAPADKRSRHFAGARMERRTGA